MTFDTLTGEVRTGGSSARPGLVPSSKRSTGRRRPKRTILDRLEPGGFLAPAVLLVAVLLLFPFAATVYQSLTVDNGFSSRFVGLDNYLALFQDPLFFRSLINTLMWTVGTLIIPVGLGLAIAAITNGMRGGKWLRFAFVLPYALSGTATAVIWGFILRTDGALNQALSFVGQDAATSGWLLEWPTNTIVMILANTWQAVGIAVILFLVGLQSIPAETVEAGKLDGATGFNLFAEIIFPQLKAVTVVVIGMSIANSLRVFDLIWLLTKGGPGGVSETLAVTMYRQSFIISNYGYGAAVAVVLAIIVVAFSWVYLRNQMPKKS